MARILIIGYGDIGGGLADKLVENGHEVTGLRRTVSTMSSGVSLIQADVTNVDQINALKLDYDQLVYILSPSTGGMADYRAVFETGVDNVLNALKKKKIKTPLMFVSSSRVYGQNKGEWVSEKSMVQPSDERGKLLLAAENKFLAFCKQATVVRFSGIYGRSNYLVDQIKKGMGVQKEPPYYTNRIHREDCIGVLEFLISKKLNGDSLEQVYIASDSDPASKWEVVSHLVSVLKLKSCEPQMFANKVDQNKRLDNSRLLEEGYAFKFKTFKDGYGEAISGQN